MRGFARPCPRSPPVPLRVGPEQRVQHPVSRGERTHVEATQEWAHDRKREERFAERVAVRRPGRRLGVVLGQVHLVLFGQIKGVDARRRTGIGETRIAFDHGFFPIDEPELPPQRRIFKRGLVGAIERPQQDRTAFLQEAVLRGRKKPRP